MPERAARPSRPLPSAKSNGRRNVSKRQNAPRRQPSPPLPQSADDMFRFFDGEVDDDDVPQLAQQRGGGVRRRSRPRGRSSPKWAKRDEDDDITLEDADSDDGELSAVDDTVDDGFFSRYRKEAGPGQRITDYASLDAQEEDGPEEARNVRGAPTRRMDRETAASAFDAVDKLFGSINSGKDVTAKKAAGRKGQGREEGSGRGGQLDRQKWLQDVRARAATKGDRGIVRGSDEEENVAVDVSAVEDLSEGDEADIFDGQEDGDLRNRAMEDDFEEAEIGGRGEESDPTRRKSGFSAHMGNVLPGPSKDEDVANIARSSVRATGGTVSGEEAAFQKVMAIARQGPNVGVGTRRKLPRSPRQNRTESNVYASDGNTKGKKTATRRESRRTGDEDRSSSPKPDISRLLGLTKQIVSSHKDTPTDDDRDDYEEIDDEMEKSIVIKGDALRGRRGFVNRQKYTAVRRVGNHSHRIYSPPDEWKPMAEEEVAKVRSDSRPIGRGNGGSKLKGVVADCVSCSGSGLETCSACLGSGWVPPLSEDNTRGPRRDLLERIWLRPNLCVDSRGEAQCVMCNGIGKQFCGSCKGSGSALRKGFSLSEKNEIFDIFPGEDESFTEDEYANDEEEDEEELEEFQLYTGPEEAFDVNGKPSPLGDTDDDVDGSDVHVELPQVVGDDIEVDDESAELLATLEAMHLADLEEGGSEYVDRMKRRGIADDDDDDDVDEDFEMMIEAEEDRDMEEDEDIGENLDIASLDDDIIDDLDDGEDGLDVDDDADDDDDYASDPVADLDEAEDLRTPY